MLIIEHRVNAIAGLKKVPSEHGVEIDVRYDNRTGHHWIRLRLEGDGKRSNRSAIGAKVILESDGHEQRREVASARGYLSQSELTVTFGLGTATRVERITIQWPGRDPGPATVLTEVEVDREYPIVQGK